LPAAVHTPWTYAAFFSYSHTADGTLAPALRHALQTFGRPWYGMRACRIFHDVASLSANPALWGTIERALGSSNYFVLLASPDAASSRWVAREIDWWVAHRPIDKLLIVVTSGELLWDDVVQDFDWTHTTAIPQTLRGRFTEEPKYVDLRWVRTADDRSIRHTRFREAVVDLAATLHEKPRDDLDGEDVRQHRALRRAAMAGGLVLLLLAIAASVAAIQWFRKAVEATNSAQEAQTQAAIADRERRNALEQKAEADLQRASAEYQGALAVANQKEAEREALRANQQRDLARSRELAARAIAALQTDPDAAVRLARQAAQVSSAAEVDDALRQSLAVPSARVLAAPGGESVASAVLTSGGQFVLGTTGRSALLWDVRTGRVVRTLAGDSNGMPWTVAFAALSDDNSWLFAMSNEGKVRVWARASGDHVATFVYPGQPDSLVPSQDRRWQYVANTEGIMRVWGNGVRALLQLPLHPNGIGEEVYSRDWSKKVRASSTDVVDAQTGAITAKLAGHIVPPFTVALSADGKCVISASEDGTARVWETETAASVYVIAGHQGRVQSAAFDRQNHESCRPETGVRYAVTTGHDDNTARVWELLANGQTKNVAVLRGHTALINRAVFGDDGKQVVTASGDGTVRIWPATWREEAVITTERTTEHLVFDAAGTRLATMSDGNVTMVRDLSTGRTLANLQGSIRGAAGAFNRDGSQLVVASAGSAIVWDISKAAPIAKPRHDGRVTSASFSADGLWLVTAGLDNRVRVWSTATWRDPMVLSLETHAERAVFSPDARWVAAVSGDDATVWERETGRRIAQCRSPDRPDVSARLGDRFVHLLVSVGEALSDSWASRICRSAGVVHALGLSVFTPEADRVLTWERNTVAVRHAETWQRLLEIGDPSANVSHAAFSPNGACIVTVGEDKRGSASAEHSAWVWDARNGKLLLELRGHSKWLTTAAFSANSLHLATAATDLTIRLFQTRVCGTFGELLAHADDRLRHKSPGGNRQ
jgi:WD40 repeat protein